MYNILVVEDEKAVNDLITMNLALVGYGCEKAYSGKEALRKIENKTFHLVLLDVMLPETDGFEAAEKIVSSGIPVIFITAKDSLASKMKGFELGAEDYIVKPFEMLELQARIKIVLRNKYGKNDNIRIDDITINESQRRVFRGVDEISLTKYEFDLLLKLVDNKNIALTREYLLESIWGYDFECDSRTVDVYIQKIRKKLGWEERIKTVYRVGYRLEV